MVRSWVFLAMHLADKSLGVVGRFYMNLDKLNLLDWVLLVLCSPLPTLSSSLSSPWPSYHWHYHYQPWTDCAHIHLQSVGCRQQILLEHLSLKIQFSTFSAKSKIVIVNTVTMRHCKISLWCAQYRYGSHFNIDWHYNFCHDMSPH